MKNKHYPTVRLSLAFLSIALTTFPLFALDKPHGKPSESPAKTSVRWTKQVQQGFDFKIWLSNKLVMGKAAFDDGNPPASNCGTNGIGCEYPAGSCIEHIFEMDPLIGPRGGSAYQVVRAYSSDPSAIYSGFYPDQKDSAWRTSITDTACNANAIGYYKRPMNHRGFDDDGDGKIDEDELDGLDNDHDWVRATDDVGADGVPDTAEVGCKGSYDPITNPDPAYDNFSVSTDLKYDSCHPMPNGTIPPMNNRDRYTEGNGIPDHGEPHVDEDYGALSENDFYLSGTDTFVYPTLPIRRHTGIKVVQKSYAWKEYDPMLPVEYSFINTGKQTLHDAFVGVFVDADVGPVSVAGYYEHNYAAYIDTLWTGYVHNPQDRGSTPLGLVLLGASKPLTSLKIIWQWFDFSTRPIATQDDSTMYSWMSGEQGLIAEDQPMTSLSDTRFLYSVGPFDPWNAGDTLKLKFALVSGTSVDYASGNMIDNIKRVLVLKNGLLAGVPQSPKAIPLAYRLYQSYPNPFNPSATIAFDLPVTSHITLLVYNVLGQEVARVYDGEMVPGSHEVGFNGQNLSSGVYYYQLRASGSGASGKSYRATGKMMLVK